MVHESVCGTLAFFSLMVCEKSRAVTLTNCVRRTIICFIISLFLIVFYSFVAAVAGWRGYGWGSISGAEDDLARCIMTRGRERESRVFFKRQQQFYCCDRPERERKRKIVIEIEVQER